MTELEFIRTYAPAIVPAKEQYVDNPCLSIAVDKVAIARAMFRVRLEIIGGLTLEAQEWIDQTAALTPMGNLAPAVEARSRYVMARQCWSEIFAIRMGIKG